MEAEATSATYDPSEYQEPFSVVAAESKPKVKKTKKNKDDDDTHTCSDATCAKPGAKAGCTYSRLVQRAADIDWRALDGIRSIGITAGASAPEVLVDEVIDAFRARYDVTTEQVETAQENVEFKVPRVLREPA